MIPTCALNNSPIYSCIHTIIHSLKITCTTITCYNHSHVQTHFYTLARMHTQFQLYTHMQMYIKLKNVFTIACIYLWNVQRIIIFAFYQRSGIVDLYSFCDYVAQVQSWPLAPVSESSVTQLRWPGVLPSGGVCVAVVSATCFLPDQFCCLMGL